MAALDDVKVSQPQKKRLIIGIDFDSARKSEWPLRGADLWRINKTFLFPATTGRVNQHKFDSINAITLA